MNPFSSSVNLFKWTLKLNKYVALWILRTAMRSFSDFPTLVSPFAVFVYAAFPLKYADRKLCHWRISGALRGIKQEIMIILPAHTTSNNPPSF